MSDSSYHKLSSRKDKHDLVPTEIMNQRHYMAMQHELSEIDFNDML